MAFHQSIFLSPKITLHHHPGLLRAINCQFLITRNCYFQQRGAIYNKKTVKCSSTSPRIGAIPQEGLITHKEEYHIKVVSQVFGVKTPHSQQTYDWDFSSATGARMGAIPQEGLITHEDAAHTGDHHTSCIICSQLAHHVTSRNSTKQNRLSPGVSQYHRSPHSRPAHLVDFNL